jgi:hypothetical protein
MRRLNNRSLPEILLGWWSQGEIRKTGHVARDGMFFNTWSGVRLRPLGTSATVWPIVPAPDDRWWWVWNSWWNENWQGKPKYSEETCPSATLSTKNPTWPELESNPGRRCGKQPESRHGQRAWKVWEVNKKIWSETIKGKPLGRSERRWENNVKMYLKRTGWGTLDWTRFKIGISARLFETR